MEMIAHEPGAAKRTGVPKKVANDFMQADKSAGKHFKIPKSHPAMHTSKHN